MGLLLYYEIREYDLENLMLPERKRSLKQDENVRINCLQLRHCPLAFRSFFPILLSKFYLVLRSLYGLAREFRLYMDFDIFTCPYCNGPDKISKSIYSLNSRPIYGLILNVCLSYIKRVVKKNLEHVQSFRANQCSLCVANFLRFTKQVCVWPQKQSWLLLI